MIGFALVFALVVTVLSALALLALVVVTRRGARRDVPIGHRAVELAVGLPLAGGIVLVLALIVHGYAGDDHCSVHDHHAHLCVVHGGDWTGIPWVMVVLAAGAAGVVARLAVLLGRHLRAARAIATLRRVSVEVGDVRLVDSPDAFCFVAGLWRPRIYASTAAWHGLAEDERAAMLAHERGHVAHRDVARRFAIELTASFAAPLLPGRLVRRWAQAIEHERDRDAVQVIGDPEPVARAMVRMCRLQRGAASPGLAFVAGADELSGRVEALLAAGPSPARAGRARSGHVLALALAVVALAVTQVDVLHHALETLLG